MKRAVFLFNKIVSYENLRLAWLKARRGKMNKIVVRKFSRNVNENLLKIQKKLKSNPPILSHYSQFKVFDPKERIISVVPFCDRVMHHAIMNVLEPLFERQFIFHTYACRKGKGSHRAVKYVFSKTKKYKYFLKLDVKKYFDSIDHEVLKRLLCRIIKDAETLRLLFSIIDSYGSCIEKNKGLPIGNLTSQFFANFYLSPVDHFALEKLKVSTYVRYMDDILILDNSKERLNFIYKSLSDFCYKNFFLTLKTPVFGSVKDGVSFLGFLISSKKICLCAKSKKRKRKKLNFLNFLFTSGQIDKEKYCQRVKCLLHDFEAN